MLIPTCLIDVPFDFCTLIMVDATVTMSSTGVSSSAIACNIKSSVFLLLLVAN